MALSDLEKEQLNSITAATSRIGLGTVIQTAETSVALNNTHRTSTGADHSYIDQDVTSGSTPTFTGTNFTGIPSAGVVAEASSGVGVTQHIKWTTTTGAAADTDQALPTGTWELIDCWIVMQGAGQTSDTITIKNDANAITNAMDASGADHALVRAATINDANAEGIVGGTNVLRATTVDNDAGNDLPAIDVHVLLRRTA